MQLGSLDRADDRPPFRQIADHLRAGIDRGDLVAGDKLPSEAVLIEHYNGAFPTWLAPVQAVVIPIADRHEEYAGKVRQAMIEGGFRAEVDDSQQKMQKKIRDNSRKKVPYLLIVGDSEAESGSVNIRRRGEKDQEEVSLEEFLRRVGAEVGTRESYRR